VLLVALEALAIVGCGKKGPPVAPELRLPIPPAALSAAVDENSILVTWTNPATRFDGTPLKDLAELRLHRREDTDGGPLKPALLSRDRVVGYDEVATIRLDAPAPASVQGGSVRWVDRQGLVLGRRYVYVVTAIDSLGRSSPPSERRAITFLAPPRPPRNVETAAGDRQVSLTWEAPAEFADGAPVSGELRYLVLRATGGEGALAPVTPQPLEGTSYTDTGLENDTDYRYAVRAVRLDPRATATGAPSPVVTAAPRVSVSPSAPSNLVAVPSPGALRLAWSPSPEPSVASYVIYRAAGTGAFVRVGTTPAGNTTFIDRDVASGTTYRYAVTAIDSARRPNESVRSNEVSVTAP
jgi:predicted small lipoprotein YifL